MKRKKLFVFSFCFFSFLASTLLLVYHALPGILEYYYLEKGYKEAKLEIKHIKIGRDRFEYGETGKGPTLLLVHGFQGDKRSWLSYIKRLNKDFRVIALDLPGHGESEAPRTMKYDLESQARFVEVFVRKVGLKKFHMMGISMGGGISTVYASMYPDRVQKLIVINPFGSGDARKSDIEKEIEKGNNVFFPESLEELDEFITYIRGKPLSLAKMFKEHLLQKLKEKQAFYRKVFYQLITSEKLEPFLPEIKAKTLIVVGEKDQILHYSSVDSYKKLVPKVSAKIFKDGNHVFSGPLLEKMVDMVKTFLLDQSATDK